MKVKDLNDSGGVAHGGVVSDAAGNLYGTLWWVAAYPSGIVYKINTKGQITILHKFTGGADGSEPWGNLYLDATGNLWGTTYQGGVSSNCTAQAGCGVLYELSPKN